MDLGVQRGWRLWGAKTIYNFTPESFSENEATPTGKYFPSLTQQEEKNLQSHLKNKFPDMSGKERFSIAEQYVNEKQEKRLSNDRPPEQKTTFGGFMRDSFNEFTAPTRWAIAQIPQIAGNTVWMLADIAEEPWKLLNKAQESLIWGTSTTPQALDNVDQNIKELWQQGKAWLQNALWVDPNSFATKSGEFIADMSAIAGASTAVGAGGLGALPWMIQTQIGSSIMEGEPATVLETLAWWVFSKLLQVWGNKLKGLQKLLKPEIDDMITKGIKPTVSKWDSVWLAKYKDKTLKAVWAIIDQSDNIQLADDFGEALPKWTLPESVAQFSEAIGQSKLNIFKAYKGLSDDVANRSGLEKITTQVKIQPVLDDLMNLKSNKNIATTHPEVISIADDYIARFKDRWSLSVDDADEILRSLNADLGTFYNKMVRWTINMNEATKNTVLISVRNNLSKSLDETIETALGWSKQYRSLKDQFSALKTIEKDVAKRAIVEARKNGISLIDYTDIFNAWEAIMALGTGNISLGAKAVWQNIIKNYFKAINKPDRYIKLMFEKMSKELGKTADDGLIKQATKTIWKNINPQPLLPAGINEAGNVLQ